jgi:tRNA 2-selenouridine synthase
VPQVLDIQKFLAASKGQSVIDVRSPGEFEQGHIPGAVNIPLFDNEERAIVGTIYKQESRQAAVLKGMEIVGPKMSEMIALAQTYSRHNSIFVHCWRGGMRSGFVATLLEMYGLSTFTLKGGYKLFRRAVLGGFENPRHIVLLGGKTGSGKTLILKKLAEKGAQVIDLEGLAHHKGSAFGALGEKEQPTQEQFENELFVRLTRLNDAEPLWLEDESRLIGKKVIPGPLWEQMRAAKVIFIQLSFEERLKHISNGYGQFPTEQLKASVLKISKRLGPEQTKNAIAALEENDIRTAFEYCLHYYDKTYQHALLQREKPVIEEITFDELNVEQIAETLIKTIRLTS